MKVLHYYSADNAMISQHIKMLTEHAGLEAEIHTANQQGEAKELLQRSHYDILHIHGCWRNSLRSVTKTAFRHGARLVVTPHGQLEPWVMNERRWKEKIPKLFVYQRDIIKRAYAVIIQGAMEQECMEHLQWNRRVITVRNAVVTNSISPQQMAQQTFRIYRRIMDSDTLSLMSSETRQILRAVLKAGITGDRRWLNPQYYNFNPTLSTEDLRRFILYGRHSQINDVVERGLRVLGISIPNIEDNVACFMPDNYTPSETIEKAIGMQFVSENERLLATFRYLRTQAMHRQLTTAHLVELNRELRQHSCEEEQLGDMLQERHLLPLARRLMQLMADLTGLDEGFMPIPPLNDWRTRRLRRQIEERLKI